MDTPHASTVNDAQAIGELIAACQLADGDKAEMTAEELLSDWKGVDLAEETVAVVAPDGRIAGYADLLNRRYTQASAPPGWGRVPHPEGARWGVPHSFPFLTPCTVL